MAWISRSQLTENAIHSASLSHDILDNSTSFEKFIACAKIEKQGSI
jgi:hypothetical protein